MCLIIHRVPNRRKPSKTPTLDPDIVDDNKYANPDGFGIAWRDKDKGLMHIKYAPTEFASFNFLLRQIDQNPRVEYVAHFRRATQGPPCQRLSHPYSYIDPSEGTVLVFHNGIIDINANKDESDTEVFVRHILSELPSRWWNIPAYKFLVHESINASRLVIMTARETVRIGPSGYNGWQNKNGIWYSTSPSIFSYGSSSSYYMSDWGKEEEPISKVTSLAQYKPKKIDKGHEVQIETTQKISDDLIEGWASCLDCHSYGPYWEVGNTTFFDLPHDPVVAGSAL